MLNDVPVAHQTRTVTEPQRDLSAKLTEGLYTGFKSPHRFAELFKGSHLPGSSPVGNAEKTAALTGGLLP